MSIKSLRESLCTHQTRAESWPEDVQQGVSDLIARIDKHRPLDASGEHGDLHTPTCGCEDEPSILRYIIGLLEEVDETLHGPRKESS
jgi:hypothetical protein